MKKFLLILALFSFLVSCKEKNEDWPIIPAWLQEKIAADKSDIASDPQTYKTLGAWIQYSFNHATYFEYHNLIFSSMPRVYYYSGSEMNWTLPEYDEYQKGKCCKEIIWKGDGYIDF